ncbi:MAG: serine/threonine-protein kinase [Myxococcota bacterium]
MERSYRLVRRVGTGSNAEVFEGLATGPGGFEKRVALKRLSAGLSHRTMLELADEARISSQLSHPNVVSVFDFGVFDGVPYIVMEYVDGLDLWSLLEHVRRADRLIPAPVSLLVVRDVALALHAVHEQTSAAGRRLGIVHRDVSPSNIMVTWQGDVKLADFGVAKALNKEMVTESGTVRGKLSYLAPEQLRGQGATVASDLFALGCVLAWMLTGRSPMSDKTQRDRAVLGEHPMSGSRQKHAAHADVLQTALQPNARRRFENGEAMARAIDGVLSEVKPRVHSLTLRDWLKSLDMRRRGRPAAKKRGILDLPAAPVADDWFSLSTHANRLPTDSKTMAEPWSDRTDTVDPLDSDTIIDGFESSKD